MNRLLLNLPLCVITIIAFSCYDETYIDDVSDEGPSDTDTDTDIECGDGTSYEGSCWFLGEPEDNCDTTCGNQGSTFDSATCTRAAASAADCNDALKAVLGSSYLGFIVAGDSGENMGCYAVSEGGFLDTSGCNSIGAGENKEARICACHM